MDLLQKFKENIATHRLFNNKQPLLLAVSGGMDSMVLLHLCKEAGYTISVAHCNFNLRAGESDGDAAFVESMARAYELPFYKKSFDTAGYASQNKISIQVAARELRYEWFFSLLAQIENEQQQQAYCLTAHHADDDVETLLMNFFKGTGIAGLKGILAKKGKLIRPLLFAGKQMLESYAQQHQIIFREDSSNALNKYSRNYFRNEIIPAIEKVYPQVQENLWQNLHRFKAAYEVYDEAIRKKMSKLIVPVAAEKHIPILKLQKTVGFQAIIYELAKEHHFTAQQVPAIIQLLNSETGKYILSSTHRILKNRNWLIIAPLQPSKESIYIIEKDGTAVTLDAATLTIKMEHAPVVISADANLVQLSAHKVDFPLLLRKRKPGDYFYPLGMKKKKKISKYLSDLKLSVLEKEKIWVLESNQKIIWVMGYAIDDRFKVTATSTNILTLHLRHFAPKS